MSTMDGTVLAVESHRIALYNIILKVYEAGCDGHYDEFQGYRSDYCRYCGAWIEIRDSEHRAGCVWTEIEEVLASHGIVGRTS